HRKPARLSLSDAQQQLRTDVGIALGSVMQLPRSPNDEIDRGRQKIRGRNRRPSMLRTPHYSPPRNRCNRRATVGTIPGEAQTKAPAISATYPNGQAVSVAFSRAGNADLLRFRRLEVCETDFMLNPRSRTAWRRLCRTTAQRVSGPRR